MSPRLTERFFGRKKSAPENLPLAPVASGNNSPRGNSLSYESFSALRDQGKCKEGDALFSFRMPQAFRIDNVYLSAEADDVITVLYSQKMKNNDLYIQNGLLTGVMPLHIAKFNVHTPNIFLELMEVFVEHPDILPDFFATLDEAEQDKLTMMLAARGVLHLILEKILRKEIDDHIQQYPEQLAEQMNTLFRADSTAIKLIFCFIKLDDTLLEFRHQIAVMMEKEMQKLQHENLKDELAVSRFLEIMQYKCHDKSIPSGIIMVMKAMHSALEQTETISRDFKDKMLGSIFLLRYLCPELLTPRLLPVGKKIMATINLTGSASIINSHETNNKALQHQQIVDLLYQIAQMKGMRPQQTPENLFSSSSTLGKKLIHYCLDTERADLSNFVGHWLHRYGRKDKHYELRKQMIMKIVPPTPQPHSPLSRSSGSNGSPRAQSDNSSPRSILSLSRSSSPSTVQSSPDLSDGKTPRKYF